jgi:hypothetical protein
LFADEGSRLDAFAVAFVAQSFAPALSLQRKMKKGAKFCGLCRRAKRGPQGEILRAKERPSE